MRDRETKGPREARFRRPRRPCQFCKGKVRYIDYKEIALLQRLINEKGKILPKRTTGNCAKHQRVLTVAIKRAREIALLPFVTGR